MLLKVKEIERKVKLILADNLAIPIEEIKPASSLSDELGVDSFGMLELGFTLEKTFGISIIKHTNTLPQIVTVKDLVDFLKLKINGNIPSDY